MMPSAEPTIDEQVEHLERGRAFVDRSAFRTVAVAGAGAIAWLHDLATANVAALGISEECRSLLLTPTGRIRADFQILRTGEESLLLVQDPAQPRGVEGILAPYVLSSEIEFRSAGDPLDVLCLPGLDRAPRDLTRYRPSMLGEGVDVVTPRSKRGEVRAHLARELREITEKAIERMRIVRGRARFGVDLDEDSLPAESGLESLIDLTKGCFLGQESVAKVRNLGHPPRVVLPFRAPGGVDVGETLVSGGGEVGRVTSATPMDGGTALIARVSWDARSAALTTASGMPLDRAE